jgi:hypothetical protein
MDDVEMELNMGVKRWRIRALDKTEWPSVVREEKATSGKEEDNLKEVGPRGYDAV